IPKMAKSQTPKANTKTEPTSSLDSYLLGKNHLELSTAWLKHDVYNKFLMDRFKELANPYTETSDDATNNMMKRHFLEGVVPVLWKSTDWGEQLLKRLDVLAPWLKLFRDFGEWIRSSEAR
ncbi:MAG: hypothetical protein Q9174_004846, partial [Haloplaca sp. 1 TL-2023]